MFKKILVANRGEAAVRVIRTLKEMGIQSVAIYSSADRESLHVQLADEAVCVGGPRVGDSYLNMKNIIAAAVGTGAEAIHPGYGFLSENSEFARLCESCGITFIGPSADTIDAMGNKEHARQLMAQNGVPVTPGSPGFIHDSQEAKKIAAEVGYPVLLKAAAGGGGKGIRQVASESEMDESLSVAQTEARQVFGDDSMYLEKALLNVKHIEVQIFRDAFGHTVYFPERDCSLQRRKQKVIEESPCELLSDEEREKLGQIAVKAAKAADYVNTGTIEFLMDQDHNCYFMEMNTRLQVEHTVTEMVTGIDLVKAQILVAAGEELPFKQEDLAPRGHAIECRINAEDAKNGFMPSTGKVDYLFFASGQSGNADRLGPLPGHDRFALLRFHAGQGGGFGRNREAAIARMERLLSELVLRGVTTNQNLHLAILADPIFGKETFTNTYLESEFLPKWKEDCDAAV